MPQPKDAVPLSFFIFHTIIIMVLPLLEPPLLFYAFLSIGLDDLMQFSFMPE
jgi:hypothetical protein